MQDYSQDREQQIILSHFDRKPPARALDIGAFNPKVFSNTRALYELGWELVMIEPSPACSIALLDAYGFDERVQLIQAAVGLEPGLMRLHITDDAVSTSQDAEYEKWKDATKFRGNLLVPKITLEMIATRFGGFDFWNIDAEGTSVDIFRRMAELGHFPSCVCVEFDQRLPELCQFATSHKYRMVFSNATNAIFVR